MRFRRRALTLGSDPPDEKPADASYELRLLADHPTMREGEVFSVSNSTLVKGTVTVLTSCQEPFLVQHRNRIDEKQRNVDECAEDGRHDGSRSLVLL